MDVAQYDERIGHLLADRVYQKVKKDPTPATERKVLQVIRGARKEIPHPQEHGYKTETLN